MLAPTKTPDLREVFETTTHRSGLSLIEVVFAVSILTVTGSALLTSAMSALQSGTYANRIIVAEGIADQLIEEVFVVGFPRGSNTLPTGGMPRVTFNHVDDFANYDRRPPVDRVNRKLGTEDVSGSTPRSAALQTPAGYLDGFRQRVMVERIFPISSGFSVTSTDTDYRRITVQVSYVEASGSEMLLATRTLILSRLGFSP